VRQVDEKVLALDYLSINKLVGFGCGGKTNSKLQRVDEKVLALDYLLDYLSINKLVEFDCGG
jgi:hypothetical protein